MTDDDTRSDPTRRQDQATSSASIAGLRGYIVAAGLELNGPETAELLSRHGISPALMEDPDARIGYSALMATVADLVARPGNDDLGLRAGMLGRWGFAAEYLLTQAPDLLTAFKRFLRFAHLVANPVRLSVRSHDGGSAVVGSFPSEQVRGIPASLRRQGVDIWLASFTSFGRRLTGVEWCPTQVRVTYPEPRSTRSLEEFYRAPIVFASEANELIIDRATGELPIRLGDANVARIVEQHCNTLLARTPPELNIVQQLREAIRQGLKRTDFSLEMVAKHLEMTPRTLQRRLADHGSSYTDLLDQVKHDLAVAYLHESVMSSDDIAALLGYSDRRAFLRAFKRWTGSSPSSVRKAGADTQLSE